MRQTDRTFWTVAAWLPTEGCYGAQLLSGCRETVEEHRRLMRDMGHDESLIDTWETSVHVLRGSGA